MSERNGRIVLWNVIECDSKLVPTPIHISTFSGHCWFLVVVDLACFGPQLDRCGVFTAESRFRFQTLYVNPLFFWSRCIFGRQNTVVGLRCTAFQTPTMQRACLSDACVRNFVWHLNLNIVILETWRTEIGQVTTTYTTHTKSKHNEKDRRNEYSLSNEVPVVGLS